MDKKINTISKEIDKATKFKNNIEKLIND